MDWRVDRGEGKNKRSEGDDIGGVGRVCIGKRRRVKRVEKEEEKEEERVQKKKKKTKRNERIRRREDTEGGEVR